MQQLPEHADQLRVLAPVRCHHQILSLHNCACLNQFSAYFYPSFLLYGFNQLYHLLAEVLSHLGIDVPFQADEVLKGNIVIRVLAQSLQLLQLGFDQPTLIMAYRMYPTFFLSSPSSSLKFSIFICNSL